MCYVYAYADGSGVSVNLFRTELERDQAVYDLLAADYEDVPFGRPGQDSAEDMWVKYCTHDYTNHPDFNLAFGNLLPQAAKKPSYDKLAQCLADLLDWEQHLGGWDAECWKRAKQLHRNVRNANKR